MYKKRVETCGQRIAEALKIRGMKQAELCKQASVPKSSLSLYLSGAYEPKQNRVYDMAKVLNVSEAWLLGYDVPMERKEQEKSSPDIALTVEEQVFLEAFRKLPDVQKKGLMDLILNYDSNRK